MNGRQHFFIFALSLFISIPLLIYYQMYKYIPLLLLSNSVVDCDEDQKWMKGKYHRFFITHSLLWPLLITFVFYLPLQFSFLPIFKILCYPVLLHLLADIYSKNPQGKYNISFVIFRAKYKWTLVWTILNIGVLIWILTVN